VIGRDRKVPDWALGDPIMERYAANIWGRRVYEDNRLFEIMSLQIFQAGLNWRMILIRWDAFHKAFKEWSIDDVASFGDHEIEILLSDSSIIRNKKKIEACTENARIIQSIQKQYGSFCHWFYDILKGDDLKDLQTILKKKFRFVGPEIARMWLMASGRIPSDNLD
jgi:DNA-3-methyladenine glycosylase I